jgi:hypothetical protein
VRRFRIDPIPKVPVYCFFAEIGNEDLHLPTMETKTKATAVSVDAFIEKLADETTRDDCRSLIRIMQKITGAPPVMWGPSIIGFGRYHYKYPSGHEGDMCLTGFSPRKPNMTVYAYPKEPLMKKLGKHKAAKACIYFKRLEDIDVTVLEKLIKINVDEVRKKYPST